MIKKCFENVFPSSALKLLKDFHFNSKIVENGKM